MTKTRGSPEIEIADRIEGMLRRDIFTNQRFEIRRAHDLIPINSNVEKHELQLYVDEAPSLTAGEIADVDALVLDKKGGKVQLLLEYEQKTNPKDLIGNFLAPFMANSYRSNYRKDKNGYYALDKRITCFLLIVCLQRPRGKNNRDLAPIQKGDIVRKKLLGVVGKGIESSNILMADIIIGDTLDYIEAKTRDALQSIVTK